MVRVLACAARALSLLRKRSLADDVPPADGAEPPKRAKLEEKEERPAPPEDVGGPVDSPKEPDQDKNEPPEVAELSLLECPVCVDTMESPVRQCVNGHSVCNSCRARVSSCPLCRGQLTPQLHPALDPLARTLTLPCALHARGCGARLQVRRREQHLLACRYNTRACPLRPCDWTGPFCELRAHALAQHPARARAVTLDTPLLFRFPMASADVRSALRMEDFLLMVDDEILTLAMHADELPGRLAVVIRQLSAGRLRPPPISCTITMSGQGRGDLVRFQQPAPGEEEHLVALAEAQRCFLVDMLAVERMAGLGEHAADDSPREILMHCTLTRRPPDGWLTAAMAWITEKLSVARQ